MNKKFTASILKTIHAGKITPRERYYFIAKTVFRIFTGIIFLAFGMLSVALVWHLIHNFAFAEFILDRPRILGKLLWFGVPIFWMILSVALWIVTEQVVRQTNRVYRVPFWVIGITVLLIQILGGFILEQSQVGERVDSLFEKRMEWYQGAERINRRFERMPEQGFLVGRVLEIKSDTLILLNDMTDKKWEVHFEHIQNRRIQIEEGIVIRIVGEMLSEGEFSATHWRPIRRNPQRDIPRRRMDQGRKVMNW